MNDVLFEFLGQFVQAYLDDILIYSKTLKDYKVYIAKVLQKLREAGLQVDIIKYKFYIQETRFLGLIVSTTGLKIDPKKISIILDWPNPTNLKEVQGFVGFCNFYRRFIKSFSKIVKLLIYFTKKEVLFI